ncbi:hypothetical protein ACR9GP_25360 [Enterobacter ludwigii]
MAYSNNDINRIDEICSDFMYMHLLPNANGRVSQVIRNCFSLAMNVIPCAMLTQMTPYIYPGMEIDMNFTDALRNISSDVLNKIKCRKISLDEYRLLNPEAELERARVAEYCPGMAVDMAMFDSIRKEHGD